MFADLLPASPLRRGQPATIARVGVTNGTCRASAADAASGLGMMQMNDNGPEFIPGNDTSLPTDKVERIADH